MSQIKKTIKILRRSPYQALAAALAMTLTFFVGSIFVILIIGGQLILNYVEQRPELHIFFKDEASDTRISEITQIVKSSGSVIRVKYTSKEEALAIYRERLKGEPLLLESVTADYLPRSIQVTINKPEDIISITKSVESLPEVDQVVSLTDEAISNLSTGLKIVRIGGIILVSTLMAISFLIIIMVVGMRIALRRDEISIMNLVGATKWYISRPFFVEGAIYGIVGSTIAVLLTYSMLLFYSPNIQEFLGEIQIFPVSPLFFVYLWAAEALVAILVGIIGAAIALFRYLKIR
ncbi:FtsX-like permease family protein [Candidatus Curtissbacteria bacterium]|nr:FtsX-like permease family protein [Candidatus Curtissbacteria bacterium]